MKAKTRCCRHAVDRSGITLLEVFISMSVVLVAIMILVPKLNRAREKARENSCKQGARLLAQAVLQYEAIRGYLPPAGLIGEPVGPHCGIPPHQSAQYGTALNCYRPFAGAGVSWIVLVLPQLGHQDLYDEFDLSIGIKDYTNSPQARTPSSVLCPTALSTIPRPYYDGVGILGYDGSNFAKGNYAAYVSPVHANHQQFWQGGLGGYVPGENRGQPLSAITDGLGPTLLLAEVRSGLWDWDIRGSWALPYPGTSQIVADWHPSSDSPHYVPWPDFDLSDVLVPNTLQASDYIPFCNGWPAIQAGMPCASLNAGGGYWAAAARSDHPGGVNVAYLDGSVTFLSDDIDPLTYVNQIYTRDSSARKSMHAASMHQAD